MQIKPADVDRFLGAPPPGLRLVLLHGSDDGLISERAERFAAAVTGDDADPFSRLRLEASDLSADPQRLSDEAHAIPMFGGRRCIMVRLSGNWSVVPAVEPLLAAPPSDSWIVFTAGELRKTSPVRRLFEGAKAAAAIACYPDTGRDLERLIDEEVRQAGLRIDGEARAALRDLLGGDRLVSRSELAKLVLYASGGDLITIDDVRAVVGDASAFAIDEAVDAAFLGDAATFVRSYGRLLASGTNDYAVAGAALRHLALLHRARALADSGSDTDSAIGNRIFPRRKPTVARQLGLWSMARIERAMALVDRAIMESRLRGAISAEIVGQAMMMLSALAAGARPRRQE